MAKDRTLIPGIEGRRQKEIIQARKLRARGRPGVYDPDGNPVKPAAKKSSVERTGNPMAEFSVLLKFLCDMEVGKYFIIGNIEPAYDINPTLAAILLKTAEYDYKVYETGRPIKGYSQDARPFDFVAVYNGNVPAETFDIMVPVYSILTSYEYIEVVVNTIDNLYIPINWKRRDLSISSLREILAKTKKWKK